PLGRGGHGFGGVGGEQRGDQVRVRGGGAHVDAEPVDLFEEVGGVDEVPVVGQGDRSARGGGPDGGLGVLPGGGPGGGVTGVADREVPLEGRERGLVEDLRHQAQVLVDDGAGAVGDGYPGGLLASVLQRVQPEVREFRDLFAGSPDADDAAGVARTGLVGIEFRGESTVTSGHCSSSVGWADARLASVTRVCPGGAGFAAARSFTARMLRRGAARGPAPRRVYPTRRRTPPSRSSDCGLPYDAWSSRLHAASTSRSSGGPVGVTRSGGGRPTRPRGGGPPRRGVASSRRPRLRTGRRRTGTAAGRGASRTGARRSRPAASPAWGRA